MSKKTYRITSVHNVYYVQHWYKQEWLFFTGEQHIPFVDWNNAFDWIKENKLEGNELQAVMCIQSDRKVN